MADFLTTQGTSYFIEQIVKNAKKWLILVSPYLQLSQYFYDRLLDADRQNIKIAIVYGKKELKQDENNKLAQLKNLALYFCSDLHAKCYMNEEFAVISSMNMYDYSERKNREMGVLIRKDKDEDRKIYDDALKEVKSIIAASIQAEAQKAKKPQRQKGMVNNTTKSKSSEKSGWARASETLLQLIDDFVADSSPKRQRFQTKVRTGHCIRCGTSIPYDPSRPYCWKCFTSWLEWENPAYKEKHCHSCGKPDKSSMLYPLCNICFQRSQRY